MQYQILESTVFTLPITPQNGREKEVVFKLDKIAPDVVVTAVANDGRHRDLRSRGESRKIEFNRKGDVHLMALLRPERQPPFVEGDLVYAFGQNLTTEQIDVPALLRFTFSDKKAKNHFGANSDKTVDIGESDLEADYRLDFQKGRNGVPATSRSCRIEVVKDGTQSPQLERAVEVHIFDHTGKLNCVVDTDENSDITLDLASAPGFRVLCLVDFILELGPPISVLYSIGDPETEAKVLITEDDTNVPFFAAFLDLLRSIVQWFKKLFFS